jgi:predicted small integral membrane protein
MLKLNLCNVQRLLKSLLVLSIGLYGVLVSSGNIVDYDNNWQLVQNVLSMSTMEPWFKGDVLKNRAVTNEGIQQAIYLAIITGETIFGILCSIGGIQMLWGLATGRLSLFVKGKMWFTLGCIPALLVWYTGFVVIGGEYFAMWGNQWNGQKTAYTFMTFIMISLFYISQAEAAPIDNQQIR